jgi:3-methyladenine DNA glycosylase Tag
LSEDPGSTHDQNMSEPAVNLKKLFEQILLYVRTNLVGILWIIVIAGSMYYYTSLMVGG